MKITVRMWILLIVLIFALLAISPSFKSGVSIKTIERNSTALQQGMQTQEIIVSINNNPINTLDDYSKAVEPLMQIKENQKIIIITNKGEYMFFDEPYPNITVGEIPKTRIKTGLDLSGGARALVKPVNVTLTQSDTDMLVDITNQRLNAFGLSDVVVRPVTDLSGEVFMLVEVAGATPGDIKSLVGQQGKFEAKIGNQSVFEGGKKDIASVCRNDAQCAGIYQCSQNQGTYFCNFRFTLYLTEDAANRHADITKDIPVDETGRYLKEKLYLYVDDVEVDSLLISVDLKGSTTTQISIQGSGSGNSQADAYDAALASMKKLQTILLTGSLPYKLEIVKLDTISPMLGSEFTKAILTLGLIVFILVSVSIFIKYRRIKVSLAVIATMFSEVFITLGVAAMIRWNLDAAAIAGIIAGMGTGVNDQIVIIDESLSGGKESSTLKQRIKRALFIIIGAFFTIVAAMLPLFWAGAGLLKGFALTTIIGVSVGIIITRPAFADFMRHQGEQ